MLLERASRERATPGDLLEKGTVLIVEHGEPGVALEILCDQLADDDIAVTRDTLVEPRRATKYAIRNGSPQSLAGECLGTRPPMKTRHRRSTTLVTIIRHCARRILAHSTTYGSGGSSLTDGASRRDRRWRTSMRREDADVT